MAKPERTASYWLERNPRIAECARLIGVEEWPDLAYLAMLHERYGDAIVSEAAAMMRRCHARKIDTAQVALLLHSWLRGDYPFEDRHTARPERAYEQAEAKRLRTTHPVVGMLADRMSVRDVPGLTRLAALVGEFPDRDVEEDVIILMRTIPAAEWIRADRVGLLEARVNPRNENAA